MLSDGGCTSDLVLVSDRMDIELVNDTSRRARFDLWRLYEGHSYGEFVAFVAEVNRRLTQGEGGGGPAPSAELLTGIDVAAARRVRLQQDLIPGNYAVACFRGFPEREIIAGGSFVIR